MNPRVTSVKYHSPYKLMLTFTNNELKEFDFGSYLDFPVYKVLKDESFCSKAKVQGGAVSWDDYTDFDPDTLYIESKPLIGR